MNEDQADLLRLAGDYSFSEKVDDNQARKQISQAEQFLTLAEQLIGPIPPATL